MESVRLKRIAQPKFLTVNPGTTALTIRIIIPLIIKVNIPKVKILIGRVRMTRTGLIIALIMPRTKATTIAVKKLATFTPDKR